jgi:hypothetical protein
VRVALTCTFMHSRGVGGLLGSHTLCVFESRRPPRKNQYPNVFAASMSSGLLYSLITMPLESAKNRMAFQSKGPDGVLPYRTTVQTLRVIAAKEGVLALWSGFLPYYGRCGGHSVAMFVLVDVLREYYSEFAGKKITSLD